MNKAIRQLDGISNRLCKETRTKRSAILKLPLRAHIVVHDGRHDQIDVPDEYVAVVRLEERHRCNLLEGRASHGAGDGTPNGPVVPGFPARIESGQHIHLLNRGPTPSQQLSRRRSDPCRRIKKVLLKSGTWVVTQHQRSDPLIGVINGERTCLGTQIGGFNPRPKTHVQVVTLPQIKHGEARQDDLRSIVKLRGVDPEQLCIRTEIKKGVGVGGIASGWRDEAVCDRPLIISEGVSSIISGRVVKITPKSKHAVFLQRGPKRNRNIQIRTIVGIKDLTPVPPKWRNEESSAQR